MDARFRFVEHTSCMSMCAPACVYACAMYAARALSSTLTTSLNPASLAPPSLRWRCQVACVNNQGLRLRQTQAVPSPTSLLRSSTSSCSPRPLLCNLETASPRLNRRPVCRSSTDVPTLAYRQLCLVHLPCCSLLRCEMRQDGHDLSLVSCLYLPLRHPCVLPGCSHI